MYELINSRWAHSHIPGHVYKKVIRKKLEQVFPNMKTSHIHQTAIPLKSVLTACFPRKEHYRATWKSANNVQTHVFTVLLIQRAPRLTESWQEEQTRLFSIWFP